MIDHRQRFRSPKHNTTKSMVGILPFTPHHYSLQYIHHVHLMQRDQNRGVTVYVITNGNTTNDIVLVFNLC